MIYIIKVDDGVSLLGPYETSKDRDMAAEKLIDSGYDGVLLWANTDNNTLSVGEYYGE